MPPGEPGGSDCGCAADVSRVLNAPDIAVSCCQPFSNIHGKRTMNTALPQLLVRPKGLEPLHLAAPDPKSGVSTNFTTGALRRVTIPLTSHLAF